MTMRELSIAYRESADLLYARIKQLRLLASQCDDPEELWHLRRRVTELMPMYEQARELADLTAHYYDRGYWRNEKYTV